MTHKVRAKTAAFQKNGGFCKDTTFVRGRYTMSRHVRLDLSHIFVIDTFTLLKTTFIGYIYSDISS